MNQLISYKSNALIEASYKLTLQEQRVLLMCIGKINSADDNPPNRFQLTTNELCQVFPNIDKKHAEEYLRTAIDRLWERTIFIHHKGERREIRWIQEPAKYFEGEEKIEIVFANSIIPYLTQLRSQFTKIVIKNVSALKRTYSIRLYELLMQFKTTGQRLINVNDLREMLGLGKKYTTFKYLNQKVIKPALKELNEKSDLIIKVDPVRQGRKIQALCFQFKKNKQIKLFS